METLSESELKSIDMLKKCPFCNAPATIEASGTGMERRWRVHCTNSMCGCGTNYSYNLDWIIKVWNLRSSDEHPFPNFSGIAGAMGKGKAV